jgi:hypothetical protein
MHCHTIRSLSDCHPSSPCNVIVTTVAIAITNTQYCIKPFVAQALTLFLILLSQSAMVEEMKTVEDVFAAKETENKDSEGAKETESTQAVAAAAAAAAAAVPVPESAPASEEANPDDNLDQGIGEIHQQMNAEFVPSEPSVPASAPASSTTRRT